MKLKLAELVAAGCALALSFGAGGRARDWGNAAVVAFVLSIAVVMAAIAITAYQSALLVPNRTNTTS